MKNALLTTIYFLAIATWFASIGYIVWFDRHTHREHTLPNEVSFRSKGKIHWATPEELRRDAAVEILGLGGSMVVILTIILYESASKHAAKAKVGPNQQD